MRIQWTDYGKVKEIDTLYQGNLSPNIPNSTPSVIYPRLKFKYDATGNRLEKEYVGHYKDIYLRDPQGNVMAVYRIAKDSLFLTELPMYEEKRLGVIKENKFLMKKPAGNNVSFGVINFTNFSFGKHNGKQTVYPHGKKHFETTDWLGNVRVTYTDKKSWQQNKFALNVSSSQDYYPFGSVMEGRDLEITNYRFGFQGQEGDDEVYGKNNLWAYKYRLHDARLGRFFSVDPLADKYPFYSFYQFSGNRLIDKVELEGLEPGEVNKTAENYLGTPYEWGGKDPSEESIGMKTWVNDDFYSYLVENVLSVRPLPRGVYEKYGYGDLKWPISIGIDCSGLACKAFNSDKEKLMPDLPAGFAKDQALAFYQENMKGSRAKGGLHKNFNYVGQGDLIFKIQKVDENGKPLQVSHVMIATGKIKIDAKGNVTKIEVIHAPKTGDFVKKEWINVNKTLYIGHTFRKSDYFIKLPLFNLNPEDIIPHTNFIKDYQTIEN